MSAGLDRKGKPGARRRQLIMLLCAVSFLLVGCGGDHDDHATTRRGAATSSTVATVPAGIHDIQHVIMIVQENRTLRT